jgi:3-hydroxybutyryl-CoA dehydrogenase
LRQIKLMINSICICGAGTMGSGIAQIAAQHGFHTILYDINESIIGKAKSRIDADLQTLVDKKRLTQEESEKTRSRLVFTSELNNCIADLVIEAVVEKAEVKIGLFNQLSEINHSETIFATNTSSLSVKSIAEKVMRPERVAGLHFFNPATIMKLVEVIRTDNTRNEIIDSLIVFAKQLGKTPVLCKDSPGFIVNRVARPYYLEALKLVESSIADPGTIDKIMEASGFKMGPFKLMDLIGNDINLAVSTSVYEQLDKPERLKPSPIQQEKVSKGDLGRKTGKGYYEY